VSWPRSAATGGSPAASRRSTGVSPWYSASAAPTASLRSSGCGSALGHAREVGELGDDPAQPIGLLEHGRGRLLEDVAERRVLLAPGLAQVVHRHLDRRQRVLDLVGQPARDLLPRRDALGDHQPLLGGAQILEHQVEGAGHLAELVGRGHRHPVLELALGGGLRAGRPDRRARR
jgi:hypothetical protein